MWSKEDIDFLFANPNMSLSDIAKNLGKTEGAVRTKRSRLGIRNTESKSWTRDERRILQYNIELGKEELMRLLPGRSWDSIRSQAAYLRKRQWNL